MNQRRDLNEIAGYFQTGVGLSNESGYDFSLRDHGCVDGPITVFFEDIESKLVDLIERSDVVVGCVAWLTNLNVLRAMCKCDFVNIVVQKEDFLRNDTRHPDQEWAASLKTAYRALRGKDTSMNIPDMSIEHPHFNARVQQCCVRMDGAWAHYMDTVRCIGYGQKDRNQTPRMHHKFLVFGMSDPEVDIVPTAVWTGSYNITYNAQRSRENALLIRSKSIAHAYLAEWAQLWALSEPLNWTGEDPARSVLYVGT